MSSGFFVGHRAAALAASAGLRHDAAMNPGQPSILFVCLGNICRSPTAEGIARVRAKELGLAITIDSAGTGDWHVGQPPDMRARMMGQKRGTPIDTLRGRQVTRDDFHRFDHIIAMDHANLASLNRMRPSDGTAQLSLLLDHVPGREGQAVADPYYGDERDFAQCWEDCDAGVRGLLTDINRS